VAFRVSWRLDDCLLEGANGIVETTHGVEQIAFVAIGLPGFGIYTEHPVVALERLLVAAKIP
jgi:hypothetical protein